MSKYVLNVGQCAFDHGNIRSLLIAHFEVEVEPVDSPQETLQRLADKPYRLVLINRKLDRGGDGLELIRQIKSDPRFAEVPVMLVSNFPEAQREATEIGAAPGFGKAELDRPETLTRLREVLESPQSV